MKRFHTTTLGCKINQYETQAIAEAWTANGGVEVETPEEAELLLVNSCAVTANAVADLRQAVRKLHRANPQADIILTGCAAQAQVDGLGEDSAEDLAVLPGVTRIVPQESKKDLLAPLGSNSGTTCAPSAAAFAINDYPRARAVVMVQDGCSHRCTYCIVPLTRGPSVSRPVADIEAEVERLVRAGFAEIILSGVNLRHFGRDLPGKPTFWDLVDSLEQRFSAFEGKLRFRISSLEPGQLNGRALQTLAASRLVAPQLHLSLQSGDEDVLRLMGRGHYSPGPLLDFLGELRSIWPVFGLGADILLGFPGETRAMFENTLAYVTKLPLSYAHVFPYSPRPGTRAEGLPQQVEQAEKKRRAAQVRAVAREKKKAFLEKASRLDRLFVVVQDQEGNGVSEYYAPCRFVDSRGLPVRALVAGRPVGVENGVVLVQRLHMAGAYSGDKA